MDVRDGHPVRLHHICTHGLCVKITAARTVYAWKHYCRHSLEGLQFVCLWVTRVLKLHSLSSLCLSLYVHHHCTVGDSRVARCSAAVVRARQYQWRIWFGVTCSPKLHPLSSSRGGYNATVPFCSSEDALHGSQCSPPPHAWQVLLNEYDWPHIDCTLILSALVKMLSTEARAHHHMPGR